MALDTTFQLDFITPEQVIISKLVEMVVIPGVEGDIGVLRGHSPLITQLRAGMVCVFSNNIVDERIFVESGVAQIEPDKCVILIEKAEDEKSMNKTEILEELKVKQAEKEQQAQADILQIKLDLLDNLPYA